MENFSKLLELLPEDFLKNIIECAKILIPSLLTLLVTKYTLCKPQKQEIQRKQFECVYLPLYLLTQQYLGSKSPTTSSTGGLILALQRAILLLAPQGGVTSTFTGPL